MKAKKQNNEEYSLFIRILIYLMPFAFAIGGTIALVIFVRDRITISSQYKDYQVIEGTVISYSSKERGEDSWIYSACYEYRYEDLFGQTVYGTYTSDYVFDSKPKKGKVGKLLINESGDVQAAFRDSITWRYVPYSAPSTLMLFGAVMFATVGSCVAGAILMNWKYGFHLMSISLMLMGILGSYLAIFEHLYIGLFTVIFGLTGVLMFKRYVILSPEELSELEESEDNTLTFEVVDIVRVEENCEKLILFKLPSTLEFDGPRQFCYITDLSVDTDFEIGDFYIFEFKDYRKLSDYITIKDESYLNLSMASLEEFKKLGAVSQFMMEAAINASEEEQK